MKTFLSGVEESQKEHWISEIGSVGELKRCFNGKCDNADNIDNDLPKYFYCDSKKSSFQKNKQTN